MEQETPQSITDPSTIDTVKRPKTKLKIVVLLCVVAAVTIIGAIAAFMLLRDSKQGQLSEARTSSENQDNQFAMQYLRNCKEREVSFSSSPVPINQMAYIEPLGKMTDGHVTPTDHVYISGTGPAETNDVVMPAAGTVIEVAAMPAQYIGDRNQQTAPEDHRVVIAHNCRYVSIFIHVHKLSPELNAAIGSKLEPNSRKDLNLELPAGAKLGKLGQSVDWTLADAKTTLRGFITPKLYQSESWKIHTIDPISVYIGQLKDQMIAASLRTQEPYGGKIDYDKKGALIGNWFREGTNGYMGSNRERYWDGHLSIVPDSIDPSGTIVSTGNWQGKAAQFVAKNNPDPAKITKTNGPTKIELVKSSYLLANGQPWFGGTLQKGMKITDSGSPVVGIILVEVQSNEKLRAETFPGKTASQINGFTGAAQLYVR